MGVASGHTQRDRFRQLGKVHSVARAARTALAELRDSGEVFIYTSRPGARRTLSIGCSARVDGHPLPIPGTRSTAGLALPSSHVGNAPRWATGKAAEEAYIDAALRAINRKDGLQILSLPIGHQDQADRAADRAANRPMWVPCFHALRRMTISLTEPFGKRAFLYRASGLLPAFHAVVNQRGPRLFGVHVDHVRSTTDSWNFNPKTCGKMSSIAEAVARPDGLRT